MSDYSRGKIYAIYCYLSDDIYIGSTTKNYLIERMISHKCSWWYEYNKAKSPKLVDAFNKYGFYNFGIILIEDYPCNNKQELRQREQDWIDEIKKNNIPSLNLYRAHRSNEYKRVEALARRHKYIDTHKEQIYEKSKIKATCECGLVLTKRHITEHKRTEAHKLRLENNNIITCECGQILKINEIKYKNTKAYKRHLKSVKHINFIGDTYDNFFICNCGSKIGKDKETINRHLKSIKHINFIGRIYNNFYICDCGTKINNDNQTIKRHKKSIKHIDFVNKQGTNYTYHNKNDTSN